MLNGEIDHLEDKLLEVEMSLQGTLAKSTKEFFDLVNKTNDQIKTKT